MSADLTRLTARQMAAGLRARDFSAVELATAHIDRIDATDHALHAWVWWDRELALSHARAADEQFAGAHARHRSCRRYWAFPSR